MKRTKSLTAISLLLISILIVTGCGKDKEVVEEEIPTEERIEFMMDTLDEWEKENEFSLEDEYEAVFRDNPDLRNEYNSQKRAFGNENYSNWSKEIGEL